jgi:hypothetical protein
MLFHYFEAILKNKGRSVKGEALGKFILMAGKEA